MIRHGALRGGFVSIALTLALSACSTYRVMDNNAYRVLRRDATARPEERLAVRFAESEPKLRDAALARAKTVDAQKTVQLPKAEEILEALDRQEQVLRTSGEPAVRAMPGALRPFEMEALRFQAEGETRSIGGSRRADYALPRSEGLIPSLFQGIQDNNDPDTARAATGQSVGGLFKSIVDAIAKGTALETGGLIHHDEFQPIVGVDLFNYRLGGNDGTALGGIGIRGFAGSTVTDETGDSEANPAVAIGFSVPLGQAGGLTVGYGLAQDTNEWNGGLFVAINIAASSGQK